MAFILSIECQTKHISLEMMYDNTTCEATKKKKIIKKEENKKFGTAIKQ